MVSTDDHPTSSSKSPSYSQFLCKNRAIQLGLHVISAWDGSKFFLIKHFSKFWDIPDWLWFDVCLFVFVSVTTASLIVELREVKFPLMLSR